MWSSFQQSIALASLVVPATPPNLIPAPLQFADRAPLSAPAEQLVVHPVGLEPYPTRIPTRPVIAGAHQPVQDRAVVALAIKCQHADALHPASLEQRACATRVNPM